MHTVPVWDHKETYVVDKHDVVWRDPESLEADAYKLSPVSDREEKHYSHPTAE